MQNDACRNESILRIVAENMSDLRRTLIIFILLIINEYFPVRFRVFLGKINFGEENAVVSLMWDVSLRLIFSVHVLRFSEGAAPCPFFKSQNCALPFFKNQNSALSFFRSENALCPFSEIKNKPCRFPIISRARKLNSCRKS